MEKVILVGYPGSQHIVPASAYLTRKYLPEFSIIYLNYTGEIKMWSRWIAHYLETLDDELVIFALDDYFLSALIDMDVYLKARAKMNEEIVSIKLCVNTPEEFAEYPISTQYTIWNRKFLIRLLQVTTDPWDFEVNGSRIFKEWGKTSLCEHCMDYPVTTALSKRWEGIKTEGNNPEDVAYLKANHLI